MTKAAWGSRGVVIGAIVAGALLLVLPEWWCPVFRVTGLRCPGCGMTRALLALVRGDVAAAFGHHPLSLVVLPVGLAWAFLGWRRGALLPNETRTLAVPLAVFVGAAWLVWSLRFALTR